MKALVWISLSTVKLHTNRRYRIGIHNREQYSAGLAVKANSAYFLLGLTLVTKPTDEKTADSKAVILENKLILGTAQEAWHG